MRLSLPVILNRSLILMAYLLLSISCQSIGQSQEQVWNQYKGPNRNGTYPIDTDTIKQFLKIDEQLWKKEGFKAPFTCPVLDANNVYFGSGNEMIALKGVDGTELWRFKFQEDKKWSGNSSTPLVFEDVIYFGSRDGIFYALNTKNGKEIWRFKTSGIIASSPAIDKGKIFFQSFDQHIYALDINSGKEVWKFKASGGSSSPFIDSGHLFISSKDGTLYCLDSELGSLKWKFNAGKSIIGMPVVNNGRVYFGCYDGNFYAIDSVTGKELWRYQASSIITSSPIIYDNLVIFNDANTGVYALDSTTGNRKWFDGTKVYGEPIITNDLLIFGTVGSKHRYLNAYSPLDGNLVWREMIYGSVSGTPAVYKNLLFVISNGGTLTVYLSNQLEQ